MFFKTYGIWVVLHVSGFAKDFVPNRQIRALGRSENQEEHVAIWWAESAPPPQCVELMLRWRFCVHSSICPEIYLQSKFWIIFDISNTRSRLGFSQKHIWNIIEEIVFRNYNFLLLSETISSIMFQICFWASPSWNLVFEISKIIQNIDYK